MHEHNHRELAGRNLLVTVVLNIVITLSQIGGGLFSGSLALLSDALHNFSDVMALVIAWQANRISARKQTEAKTYGYRRAEILATLFNASVLIGIGIFLLVEAGRKFLHPEPVDSTVVIWLGLLSIVLNAASVVLIRDDAHGNMNIKAAYLHLLTDVMTSVAVVVGGLLMKYFGLFWIDPLVSVLIAVYLIRASVGLVRDAGAILMQFTPDDIDVSALQKTVVASYDVIENLHHLHVWKLDEHTVHLEAHLDFSENLTLKEANAVTASLETLLLERFGIGHCTFQCEYGVHDDKQLIREE